MRNKDTLFELENISKILQYLYMSESHTIEFFNGMTTLEIFMKEDLSIYAINKSFPDLPPLSFNSTFTPVYILGLIDKLKETPAKINDCFDNKWDEIIGITNSNLGLNCLKSIF